MKWVFMRFDQGNIAPCICHPRMAAKRRTYMKEVHGVAPVLEQRLDMVHMDFGGMVHVDDPVFEVSLGKDRGFSCYEHHADIVVEKLERKLREGPRVHDAPFYKTSSWPGTMIFLSKTDIQKILRSIKPKMDPAKREAHKVAMQEALVRANLHGRKDPKEEADIRKILGVPPRPHMKEEN